ncbi:MAG: hypothetical protein ACK4TK_12125 [Thiobacillaceae bacterium]
MEQAAYQGRRMVAEGKHCPHCGSTQVRQSRRSMGGLFHITYRCRQCKRHFKVRTYRGYALLAVVLVGLLVAGHQAGWLTASDTLDTAPVVAETAAELSPAEVAQAKKGDPAMQFKLGMQYWARLDYQKAFEWIKAAADRGHPEAIYQLGMAYLYGRGTVQNYKYAYQRFEQAARMNDHEAQYLIGIMHRDGMGVPVSHDMAYAWLNIAASNGNEVAAIERERMATIMSPAEMTRAQEISLQTLQGMAVGARAPAPVSQTPPATQP